MAAMLSGVRVLDLSRILAGPWCSQLLADYGAEVTKVERPVSGDDTRQWGPPYLTAANGDQVAAYFLCCNRGKRSIALDFSMPEAQALLRSLATRADVLLENFRPGLLARFGLDYAALSALNPRLVYCSISGFGQSGSNAQRSGYDAMIQAEAGLMSLTGPQGGEPQKVGIAVSDLMCGMYAATSILAALQSRNSSGLGCHLDLALFDTQVAWLANQGLNYLVSGELPQRLGTAHPSIAPYQAYPTADGNLMLAVGNDGQFRRLCDVLECAEFSRDNRFVDNAARVANRSALSALLALRFARRTTSAWLRALSEAGVPAGPVNGLDQVFAHAQVAERELSYFSPHPTLGKLPQLANPLRRDGEPTRASLPPPRLGEHTDAVLVEMGCSAEMIADLRARHIVA